MMSQAKIFSLVHQYDMAYFTPLWIWAIILIIGIIAIVLFTIRCCYITNHNLSAIHPHYHRNQFVAVCSTLAIVGICFIFTMCMYGYKADQSSPCSHNAIKLLYVDKAIQYKDRIPHQRKEIKENNSFTTMDKQRSLKSSIRWEQKFYHKYRGIKHLHGPRSDNYMTHLIFMYDNGNYKPCLNRYHFVIK